MLVHDQRDVAAAAGVEVVDQRIGLRAAGDERIVGIVEVGEDRLAARDEQFKGVERDQAVLARFVHVDAEFKILRAADGQDWQAADRASGCLRPIDVEIPSTR